MTEVRTSLIPERDRKEFLDFSSEVIVETRKLVLDLWSAGSFKVDLKSDSSPVTDVDLKAEDLIRSMISKRFPSHGIIGEEYENTNPSSEFQWTVDPIDGTQSLVAKIPTFGTLLGLRFRDEAILGFIDHPVLNKSCYGCQGLGVFFNGKRISLDDLPASQFGPNDFLSVSTLSIFKRGNCEKYFTKIVESYPHTRIYYDCYAHTLAITGSLAAAVEFNLHTWDLTPAEALVVEAGGAFNKLENLQVADLEHIVFGKTAAVQNIVDLLSY